MGSEDVSNNRCCLSIVMPCLNEENTIGICVECAESTINALGVEGEVLVVDNNSNDRSAMIAKDGGARVITEKNYGYGRTLRYGIKEALGDVIIMIDADTTYDFGDIVMMYQMLADGTADIVIGNRFAGRMEQKAMSLPHRLGVRFLSYLARKRFHTDVYDFHSGIRGLTKKAADKLSFSTTGMEFATEMIAEAAKNNLKIEQISVALKRCEYERRSKLRTLRDGLRHLRYIYK